MIEKNRIQELIKVFYQQPFKIFYVNSEDGATFVKPKGLFVSLGITTSINTLEKLRGTIEDTYPETAPRLVELVSKRGDSGQYLNSITTNTDIHPYTITDTPENLMTKTEAEEELTRLRGVIKENPEIELLTATQKLQEFIDRIKDWDEHQIYKTGDSEYKIFHKTSNYKKEGDMEYRIGIFVD